MVSTYDFPFQFECWSCGSTFKSAHSKRNLQRPHLQVRKRRPKGRVSQRFCKRAQAGECIILTHAQTASRAPTACVRQHPPASKRVLSTPLRLSVCPSVCLSVHTIHPPKRAREHAPTRARRGASRSASRATAPTPAPPSPPPPRSARARTRVALGWVGGCVCVCGGGRVSCVRETWVCLNTCACVSGRRRLHSQRHQELDHQRPAGVCV